MVSLVEIAPATEVTVTSLDGPGQITVKMPEAHDPLPVEVHPLETFVECAEPTPPAHPVSNPANGDDFSGGEVPGEQKPADVGAGSRFVRGVWAEQGMRLQVGDRCLMEFGPASPASGLGVRANRIVIAQHDPALTLVGTFQPDTALTLEDRQTETIFAFQPLTPVPDSSAPPAQSPPSPPPVLKLIIDDNVRIISGPGSRATRGAIAKGHRRLACW